MVLGTCRSLGAARRSPEKVPRRNLAGGVWSTAHARRFAEGTGPVAAKADCDCDSGTPVTRSGTAGGSTSKRASQASGVSIEVPADLIVSLSQSRVYFRVYFRNGANDVLRSEHCPKVTSNVANRLRYEGIANRRDELRTGVVPSQFTSTAR